MAALKNEDFRKLLATPSASRATDTKQALGESSHSFTHRQTNQSSAKKQSKFKYRPQKDKVKTDEDSIFSESQAKLNEILSKYRDRAAERRKGLIQGDDADLKSKITAAYKAVPGTTSAAASLAERRKLEIQESKYLGGDIEHTHLVKGLDYSLLNKVRGEIDTVEDQDELEKAYEAGRKDQNPDQISHNKFVKSICRLILKNELPKRNEMFAKGRMAYVVELEDEESEVPSTLLRSVVDCPSDQSNENMNADNLLINKLAQVLGYLRQDAKKRKKGDGTTKDADNTYSKQKIYDDADEYVPSRSRESKPNERKEKGSYFESNSRHNDDHRRKDNRAETEQRDRERRYDGYRERSNRDRKEERDYSKRSAPEIQSIKVEQKTKRRRLEEDEDDAYAELYPSGISFLDAGGESDEEADFSKMDMGSRKGPIKRWDFETDKEYETYQESREAMPKAAYQFGVKMNSGRKTRKNTTMANEKKLDRELGKINKILDDRKKLNTDRKVNY